MIDQTQDEKIFIVSQPKHPSFHNRLASILGNILEHYDTALFGLLAPFIAPLFFAIKDPITALILTYAILPLGFLTRPIGSLYFGWMGDKFGRKQALFYSLIGTSAATIGIGFLPTYRDIGILAPILLALARMMQSFFAAGESVGGALLLLENEKKTKRNFLSSLYDTSSVCGILLASASISLISRYGSIEKNWRILFWAGGLTAALGVFLRLKGKNGKEFIEAKPEEEIGVFYVLKKNRQAILSILLTSGFSHITYSLAFTLMNGYVPLITTISKNEVMQINTILLVVDMMLLPCFGYLSHKFGKEKIMLLGVVCSTVGAIPLFSLLDGASLATVVIVRVLLVLFGTAFAAPYRAWSMEQIEPRHRYLILSFGSALGSQLIGAPAPSVCLWLYKTLKWSSAPGLYLMAAGMTVVYIIYTKRPFYNLKKET